MAWHMAAAVRLTGFVAVVCQARSRANTGGECGGNRGGKRKSPCVRRASDRVRISRLTKKKFIVKKINDSKFVNTDNLII